MPLYVICPMSGQKWSKSMALLHAPPLVECYACPAVILVTTESLGLIGEADADAAAKYAKRRDTKRGNEQQEQRGVLEPGIG